MDRYEALLRMAKAMAVCCDCDEAAEALTTEMHNVVSFDYLHLVAFESTTQTVSWELLHAHGRTLNVSDRDGFLREAPTSRVHESQQLLVTDDWRKEIQYPEYKEFLSHFDIVSTCSLPLARGQRRLGVLTLGSSRPHAYSQEESRFLQLVADQLALVLDAAVNLHSSERLQDRLKLILDLTNQVVSNLELNELLRAISTIIRRVMACDAAAVMLPDADGKHLRVHALDFPESRGIFTQTSLLPIEGSLPGKSFKTGQPFVLNRLDREIISEEMYVKAKGEGLNSFCDLPLVSRKRLLGVLVVARREENTFHPDQVQFLIQVANQVPSPSRMLWFTARSPSLKTNWRKRSSIWKKRFAGRWTLKGLWAAVPVSATSSTWWKQLRPAIRPSCFWEKQARARN